jgi:conjugative relaxase-like TrwC/TraI family protein
VLNIGRLAAGGEGYYLEAVASGVEDYYTGSGEAPGFWLTEAAAGLGLTGRVTPEDLRHVLAARHPRTGADLPRTARRRVPGFDLAFRAPKSVSLLYGLGDEATAAVVRDAHDQAVAAALGYLQRQAGFARRGRNGAERVPIDGLVAAAFRHRTSRAGDPLLHTHVLVSNLGRCPDGQWRTLDARLLYSHAKTAGYLYQAALRDQLSRRLGVAWTPVRNGTAEVAGVPAR